MLDASHSNGSLTNDKISWRSSIGNSWKGMVEELDDSTVSIGPIAEISCLPYRMAGTGLQICGLTMIIEQNRARVQLELLIPSKITF
jgi:hypothetical protein